MKVLVTGGFGFIGSNLAAYHLNKGDQVFSVDNFSTGRLDNLREFLDSDGFDYEEADLLNWGRLDELVEWADRIYHTAAVVGMFNIKDEPVKILNSNVLGTQYVLDAVASSKKRPLTVLTSSSSVYGHSDKPVLSEDDYLRLISPDNLFSCYAISKLAAESYAVSYREQYQIPLVIPRLFNVIGPRQVGRYGMVVPRFIQQASSNQPMTIFGDGKQTRSFCDVRDVVVALDGVASNPDCLGQIINVGNDYEITINALAELVKKITGSHSQSQYLTYEEAYGVDWIEISQRRPSLSRLGFFVPAFKHQWTLEMTIKDLFEYHKETGEI